MTAWIKRPLGTRGVPAGVGNDALVEYRHADDPKVYDDRAGNLAWGDGLGAIEAYRRMVPEGVGDVTGKTLGSAARFNADKPDLSLIPARAMAGLRRWAEHQVPRAAAFRIDWTSVLDALGDFQMRAVDDDGALYRALWLMDNDGAVWADCARVFAYGREKYSPWNWARGQAWSVPIASVLRHIVFGTTRGEDLDPESGLSHRGHIACNIVMLLWFLNAYPAGDDRFTPPA